MKLVVILLVIVVLLFVVLVVWGAGKGGSRESSHPRAEADQFEKERNEGRHSMMDSFGSKLSRFGPKVKLDSLRPSLTSFTFSDRASYIVTVLGDSDHKFRQAKFAVTPATCAHVKYEATSNRDADEHLRQQDSNDIENKRPVGEFTLTILDSGGKLTVERWPPGGLPGPCRVDLK